MKNSVSQSFSIPMELIERLTRAVTITGKSRSQIAQAAFAEYLNLIEQAYEHADGEEISHGEE